MTEQITPTIKVRREFDREVEKIRGYADLTPEAKARRMAEAYERAEADYRQAIEDQEREAAQKVARAEKKVLGMRLPMSASDAEAETFRMSYRDAYEKAHYAGYLEENPQATQEELARLLQQADNSGDSQLADAGFHVATLKGIREVADAYLESRPAQKRVWEEFVAAKREEEEIKNELGWARSFPLQRPPELGGYPTEAAG